MTITYAVVDNEGTFHLTTPYALRALVRVRHLSRVHAATTLTFEVAASDQSRVALGNYRRGLTRREVAAL